MTFPIMMLTKNRYNYLKATLENMAKMDMPENTVLHLFDDSTDPRVEKLIGQDWPFTILRMMTYGENVYEKLKEAVLVMCNMFDWWFYTDDDIIYHHDTFMWCENVRERFNEIPGNPPIGQIVPANTMIEYWLDESCGQRRAFGAGRSYNNSKFIRLLLEDFNPDNSNNMFDQLWPRIEKGYKEYVYLGCPVDLTFHFGIHGLHSGHELEITRWLPHFAGDKTEGARCLKLDPEEDYGKESNDA